MNNLNIIIHTVTQFKLSLIKGFSDRNNLMQVVLIHGNLVNEKLTSFLRSSFIPPVLNCNFLGTKIEEQTLLCFQAFIEILKTHFKSGIRSG